MRGERRVLFGRRFDADIEVYMLRGWHHVPSWFDRHSVEYRSVNKLIFWHPAHVTTGATGASVVPAVMLMAICAACLIALLIYSRAVNKRNAVASGTATPKHQEEVDPLHNDNEGL